MRNDVMGHTMTDFNDKNYVPFGMAYDRISKKRRKYIIAYLSDGRKIFLFRKKKKSKNGFTFGASTVVNEGTFQMLGAAKTFKPTHYKGKRKIIAHLMIVVFKSHETLFLTKYENDTAYVVRKLIRTDRVKLTAMNNLE